MKENLYLALGLLGLFIFIYLSTRTKTRESGDTTLIAMLKLKEEQDALNDSSGGGLLSGIIG